MAKKPPPVALQAPKGMRDILPSDAEMWEKIRKTIAEVAAFYNFSRIETPLVERAEVFERSAGETSDIVTKQMFYLKTAGNDRYALRPEGTASIARAYIEHGMSHMAQPTKLFLEGTFYRHENPQAGRLREFHQVDFEIIGSDDDPIYDVQTMMVGFRLLEELKIKNTTILLNTLGCKHCRHAYRKEIKNYFEGEKSKLCKDCERRLAENPLRILDCKEEKETELKKEAPIIIDHLCAHCHDHFKLILEYLDEVALPYALDHMLVRGLDYYTKTVFEFMTDGYGQALGGGGRFDDLIETLGGRSTPAVGCAIGLERVIDVLRAREIALHIKAKPKVFLTHIGDLAKKKSLSLIEQLRMAHVPVFEALGKDSLKAQLKLADKMGAPLALIFGQKEAFEETVIVRNLKTGAQETIPILKINDAIKRKLL